MCYPDKMIGRLRGELIGLDGCLATVECSGVGYEVRLPESVMLELPPLHGEATLFTRQVFREDGQALYGFVSLFQRRLFDLLTEVKGCGPKIALSLIGQLGEHSVVSAILGSDSKILARATGVGPRLGERIILELRERVIEEAATQKIMAAVRAPSGSGSEDELVAALVGLGYRKQEAEAAASQNREGTDEERLRAALRSLTR